MIKHNQEVLYCLNDYMKVDKPGYAVLIKGSWGCGKTYFIDKWLATQKKEKDNSEVYYTLDPIYVSLYGISSTKQIDEEIKRVVSPFLHSKVIRTAGKVLKLAISAAVRYDVDLDKEGDDDMRMTCTIDPKALLGSNDPHIKGNRLLVFDDIERSKMDIKEVMGYINYYVEHIGCNVIVVGDDEKLANQEDYQLIKEKTIGREFLLVPDIDSAVNDFIEKSNNSCKDYLKDKKDVVKACFLASRINNLRVLKQSLDDFGLMTNKIPERLKENKAFENVKQRLLANFVAVYAEDKGRPSSMENFKDRFGEEIADQMAIDFTGEGEPSSREATKIHEKYDRAGLTDRYHVVEPNYVDFVLIYLKKGRVDVAFIESEIKKDDKKPWEILQNCRSLENDVLTRNIDLNAGYLERGEFDSVDEMLTSAFVMLMAIHRDLTVKYNAKMVNDWGAKTMRDRFYGRCKSQNELYDMRQHVITCVSYYYGGDKIPEINEFLNELGTVYDEIDGKLKNDMSLMLETLSNDTIDSLYNVYCGVMPDHSTTYSSSAIFSKVDPEIFVNNFVKLNNAAKSKVVSFIVGHYSDALNIKNPEDMVYHYVDDLKTLPEIIRLLGEKVNDYQLADRLNIEMLKKLLEKSAEKIRKADEMRRGIVNG